MSDTVVIDIGHFDELFAVLKAHGYQPVGPTVRDGAIFYHELNSAKELPMGVTDEQEARSYRLHRSSDWAFFNYTSGVQSWKRFLHPADLPMYKLGRSDGGAPTIVAPDQTTRYAFIGVRPCELRAIAIHDRVLLSAEHPDTIYLLKRGFAPEDIFLSMERNMKCGVGLCGHCQFGPFFVCKDGPVFAYQKMKDWFEKKEV